MASKYLAWLQLDIGDVCKDVFVWWRSQLIALVPTRVRRVWSTDPRRITVAMVGTEWEIVSDETGREPLAPGVRGSWRDLEEILLSEKRRWRSLLTVSLRVPFSACLDRTKELPRTALKNAGNVLLLDMESRTPFRRDEVYWGWYELATDAKCARAEVRQIILKRSSVARYVEWLSERRLHLAAIEVVGEDGVLLPVNLTPQEVRRPSFETGLRRVVIGSLSIVVAVATSLSVLAIYRQEQALSRLKTEKGDLAERASAIKKRISEIETTRSQLMRVRLRKAHAPRVVEIWEEISRLVPDTAWVTDFRFEEASLITLDILAPSASELINVFAKSPFFGDVEFASTVTRDAQRNLERFQVRMRALEAMISIGSRS